MFDKVMSAIPGVEMYPIIALVFFFSFFTILVVWFIRADKSRLQKLAQVAIQDDTPHSSASSNLNRS